MVGVGEGSAKQTMLHDRKLIQSVCCRLCPNLQRRRHMSLIMTVAIADSRLNKLVRYVISE